MQPQPGLASLSNVTLVVKDVDDALAFYTETLDFEPRMDEVFELDGVTGRWVTIGLPGQDVDIALVTADEPYYDEETSDLLESRLGTETWWTFHTADCEASVAALEAADVEITEAPQERPWGTEAMFADPCGNEFGLFEPAQE